jgi:hypothetical protein
MFGDDDKLTRNIDIPVYLDINKRLVGHEFESHGKQFVRGKINGIVNICSNH